MSSAEIRNLSREKIQQIIAAIGVESEEDTKYNIDAYEYNWNQPRSFDKEQLKLLVDREPFFSNSRVRIR